MPRSDRRFTPGVVDHALEPRLALSAADGMDDPAIVVECDDAPDADMDA